MALDLGSKPLEGRYVAEDWQREHSDVVHCPECEGPVLFKDWEDNSGRVVATHYRCVDCRVDWWGEA